jgi:transcription elongation GreA/GreB family factor
MLQMNKTKIIAAIRTALVESLDAVERTAAMARDETTSGETRSEGKYDTRATEASYLARGQAKRIEDLRHQVAWFTQVGEGTPTTRVGPGALVSLEGDQQDTVYLAPVGGTQVEVEGLVVRVISLASPLGKAMAGLTAGDGFEVETPRGRLDLEIGSVC